MKRSLDKATICIVGLGYVGLPLARVFSRSLRVIGYDNDKNKIKKLNENNRNRNFVFTDRSEEISKADFLIICVPTPVTESKAPDLSYIESAARVAGQNMKRGSIIVLESTVYPGVTEEIIKPILENESDLKCGDDFKIAYSPERINPGDKQHTVDRVTKVVAGMDDETTELVAELYRRVARDVFIARDIRTAEAAKVIENIQRDLNIALMNELALIFEKMGLNTKDVLDAAATKWNFHRYSPGLVGGHCIPVDPYYLVYKSKELGYQPRVILAGRTINNYMPRHIAEVTKKALKDTGKSTKSSKVLIMGLTYKANVPDTRENPVRSMIKELKGYGIEIYGYDPLLDNFESEFGITMVKRPFLSLKVDVSIVTVGHDSFKEMTLEKIKGIMSADPILIDVRGIFPKEEAEAKGFIYRSL